jgi:hypothetical protein
MAREQLIDFCEANELGRSGVEPLNPELIN